ncbi:hypothetical protein C0993_009665 [Termitomyces sp. T159_Od127]|nr:hypothetical protein C0993_009665 [Termitomyces sp. T159_Od127]
MTQHVESSQSSEVMMPTQHIDNEQRGGNQDTIKMVQNRTKMCQKFINDVVNGRLTICDFIQSSKDIGFNAAKAQDHVEEVTQRIELHRAKVRHPGPPLRETTPNLGSGKENTRESQSHAIEQAAWKFLHERLKHALVPQAQPTSLMIEQLAKLLGEPKKSPGTSTIPQFLLTAVPHLAVLQNKVLDDPHILRTWYLCQEYSKKK